MNAVLRSVLVACPAFALVACAHPQTVSLTSASAAAPAPVAAPAPAPPSAQAADEEDEATPSDEAATPSTAAAADGDAKPPKPSDPLSFAALSAQLGTNGNQMALTTDAVGDGSSAVPRSRGLAENGYTNAAGMHQAVPERVRGGGDVKVSGGVSVASVREKVRSGSDRLRVCYEKGLASDPRAAGVITVSFAIDAAGQVGEVEATSEAFDGGVTSCVSQVFAAMTFAAPKSAPAHVTYPIEFSKQ